MDTSDDSLFQFLRFKAFPYALLIVSTLFASQAVFAQRQSPLVYDDPEYIWLDNRDPESPRPSPNAIVGLQIGSTRVFINYGRPGVKGRMVYGNLVSYGNIWRTGANEATTITFSDDVEVEGNLLPAGTYSLFTIPGPEEWAIVFSREDNQWGNFGYNPAEDVLRIAAPAREAEHQERFEITFDDIDTDDSSASAVLRWERIAVSFEIAEPD